MTENKILLVCFSGLVLWAAVASVQHQIKEQKLNRLTLLEQKRLAWKKV